MAGRPLHVFISYSRKNLDAMVKLRDDLLEYGCSVWTDQHQIIAGQDWEMAIEGAIEECALLLVILTPDSCESIMVRRECRYAQQCGKVVIPLMWEKAKIPMHLIELQFIDFSAGYAAAFKELLDTFQYFSVPILRPTQIDPKLFPIDPHAEADSHREGRSRHEPSL